MEKSKQTAPQYTQKTCIQKQYLNANQQVFSLPVFKRFKMKQEQKSRAVTF